MSRAIRPQLAAVAVAVLAAGTQLISIQQVQARPITTGAAATANALVNAPSDTGASDLSNLGTSGWAVQSSAVATQPGAQISTPGFSISSWLPVANRDAGAPR